MPAGKKNRESEEIEGPMSEIPEEERERSKHTVAELSSPSQKEHTLSPLRVAIIGGGVSGLCAAYHLKKLESEGLTLTLFETGAKLGGHANTIDVVAEDGVVPVDTGFMVYNTRNYPYLIKLFEELGIAGLETNMGFSVSMDNNSFEWCADTLSGLFATPSNAINPRFYKMTADIFRFNTTARKILSLPRTDPILKLTVGEFLQKFNFSEAFSSLYLIPMTAAIWSASSSSMLQFPIIALLTFLDNHLLLQTKDNIKWRTPAQRSQEYVAKISAVLGSSVMLNKTIISVVRDPEAERGGVFLTDSAGQNYTFDKVIFACHPDQAAAMISKDPRAHATQDVALLGQFEYSSNDTYLHSDASLMPRSKAAWTSWNYIGKTAVDGQDKSPVFVTYWLNQLQALETKTPIFVSLNPSPPPASNKVHQRISYSHPQYSLKSVAAQSVVLAQQGKNHTFFAGAWLGYGFHEDGARSGFQAAELLSGKPTGWTIVYPDDKKLQPQSLKEKSDDGSSLTMTIFNHMSHPFKTFTKLFEKLSKRALLYFLGKGFKKGQLQFHCPGGEIEVLGPGAGGGFKTVALKVLDERFFTRVALEYDLGLARSFIAGEWELPNQGADFQGLTDLFDLLMVNTYTVSNKSNTSSIVNTAITNLPTAWIGALINSILYFTTMDNSIANSRKHIHAHYDLSNDLFRTFLDHQTMMYSSGIFEETFDSNSGKLILSGSLESAQERKIEALLQRLRLSSHHTLLDIGFGWGGIAIAAASRYGCRVHGITLSVEQKKLAEERVRERGLESLITFELCDYRDFAKSGRTFDRIVSCEMIEAVGHKYLPSFFDAVDRILTIDGIFVMQAITMPESRYPIYKKSADFINTVIFPGGLCPSLNALIDAMAVNSTLHVDSVHNTPLHYAETLRHWRLRFNANKAVVLGLGFDDKFIRIWNLYLSMCESSFSHQTINLQQIVFSRTSNTSLCLVSQSCPVPMPAFARSK